MIVPNAMIVLKSAREIELMRAAGRLVCQVLDALERMITPGVTTAALDAVASRLIQEAGATALFLGVKNAQARFPFPASICASVNDAVVHGVPSDRPLAAGDIVSVDCGVRYKGFCGDSARTFAVGKVAPQTQRLMDVTRATLDLAIARMRPKVRWSVIAAEMQRMVEEAGFGVVTEFVGHGIGRDMHEEPKVPNYFDGGRDGSDFELVPGMTLAIEPMVTAGRPTVKFADRDGWTIVTKDGSAAAHFEHTVAITRDGSDVLTDGR